MLLAFGCAAAGAAKRPGPQGRGRPGVRLDCRKQQAPPPPGAPRSRDQSPPRHRLRHVTAEPASVFSRDGGAGVWTNEDAGAGPSGAVRAKGTLASAAGGRETRRQAASQSPFGGQPPV
ncbi:hypothetical protein HPG69_006143 [Diceros bicornis minor]|uniref:Uncharacterized protein n=1 Tax=Diceros bicornis minor TaxID=77932 RepID=A0A7J7EYF8_DICBM|nr:hypothetical protein HPG69_006143 [Diceros bicornis minor]